jgi:hypothetical protein
MSIRIRQFRKNKQSHPDSLIDCSVGVVTWIVDSSVRAVKVPGHERASKDPVMGRVAKDVGERHGLGGEAVDEDGFELALNKVEDRHEEDDVLDWRDGGGADFALEVGIEVGTEKVENDGVNEERAQIFDDEDGAPGDLGSCRWG